MDKKERKKREEILKIKREQPEYKLRVIWHKSRSKFSPLKLVSIAKEIDYPEIQKSAIREFLNRNELAFADFYELLNLPKKILQLSPDLENQIWKECFDICTPDNLRELIDLGEERAANELFLRIEKKSISMKKAKQILISLLEKSQNEKIKMALWKKIRVIGPNEEELKYLLELNGISRLWRYIERLLAKKHQKNKGKAINKIKKLVAQIKQRQE